MATQQFADGEYVDITIRGALVVNTYTTTRGGTLGTSVETGRWLVFKTPAETHQERSHAIPLHDSQVTVERAAPAQWPPQPGDLWRDSDGDLWAWRQYSYTEDGARTAMEDFVSLNGKHTESYGDLADEVQRAFGPLTLVRREPGAEAPF